MPTHIRAKCSWQFENTDPKNQAVINPCFRHQFDPLTIAGTDYQALADDLKTALAGWVVKAQPLTVTLYNIEGAKPNYPKAISKTVAPSAPSSFLGMPQQAACLSFYSGTNTPRNRGRLFIPAWITTQSSALLAGERIDTSLQTKIAALVPIFAGLGGANVDWIVWSPTRHAAGKVSDYWIDDSWDLIRSRKLKASGRATGTTSG